MLKESGRIVAVEDDALWVETVQQSTCSSCAAKKGCGQRLLSTLGAKPVYLRVLLGDKPRTDYSVDQTVVIGVPNDVVVKGSLLVYLLPLLFMIVFSGIAHSYYLSDSVSALFGLCGLVVGGLLIRAQAYIYRNDQRIQPVLIQ